MTRIAAIFLLFLISLGACNKAGKTEHQGHGAAIGGPNQDLYDQVMAVHDEVMPKMNDLYKAKTELSTRLKLPGLPENEREAIQLKIARIDSASEGMMVWMRQFDPPADSVNQDSARNYLEDQLAKVKKVKEDILTTLENSH